MSDDASKYPVILSPEQFDAAIERAINRAFEKLGFDISDHTERERFRDNMSFAEAMRMGVHNVWSIMGSAGVMAAMGAIGFLIIEGVKAAARSLQGGQ